MSAYHTTNPLLYQIGTDYDVWLRGLDIVGCDCYLYPTAGCGKLDVIPSRAALLMPATLKGSCVGGSILLL